jgi:hypothetical protein
MVTVLSGLEVDIEVCAFGICGEERCVLLCRHIEVLIDLSTLSEFQFQHLLFRSIADAGDTARVNRNALHSFLDADESRKDRGGSFGFRANGQWLVDAAERWRRLHDRHAAA